MFQIQLAHAIFPETPTKKEAALVTGSCIKEASTYDENGPKLICLSDGSWQLVNASSAMCFCNSNYANIFGGCVRRGNKRSFCKKRLI